ncbi:MAG: cbb3-type cytochrome c oxidase subunit 3 [Acetobacteraceae bacterium]|nr:cbb3-type cytochrome c oxidase subunit 3 [Acetobacteraceae bacterium]
MTLQQLHEALAVLFVVWFFLLFGGILLWVLRPGTQARAREHAEIPFRNDPN